MNEEPKKIPTRRELVQGILPEKSPAARKRLEVDSAAETARANADVENIWLAYEKVVQDRYEMEVLLGDVMRIFKSSDAKLLPMQQDVHSVRAMRDVALSAIDFAKSLTQKKS